MVSSLLLKRSCLRSYSFLVPTRRSRLLTSMSVSYVVNLVRTLVYCFLISSLCQAYSGLTPDGRHLVDRGRSESYSWRGLYKSPIGVPILADRLSGYVQAYTCYSSVRPFGVSVIVGGVDKSGPHLYTIEPSGAFWVCHPPLLSR